MGATETGNIKERIDTNKNGFIDTNEINEFIFDSKDGTNNLNELGNYLNSIPLRQSNQDIIKRALTGYFLSSEWGNESKKIGDKIKSNQQLGKREISLLYLQMIDITSHTGSQYQGNFDPNKSIEQICGGKLLTFIKQQYNNPLYNPQAPKSAAQKFQDNQRKDQFGLYTKEAPKNVEIPQIPQLDEKNLNNVYNYCYRLIDRAEQNFSNDVANIRYNARAEHYDQSKEHLPEFARYDILLFAFEKYSESITNKHENLIKQAGYRDYEEFSAEMKELQQFWGWISEKYPNLEETITVLQKFGEEIENNKSKYFKNDEEIEKAGKDSEEFNQYIETKSKEYKVDEIKTMLENDPETSEEAQRYCEGMKNLIEFQNEISKKGESYGDSLERYQKYIQGNFEINQKYPSINEYIETQRMYANDIEQMGKKVDFDKYEKYNKLREDSVIDKDLNNMSILGKIIMDPQDEHFPILGVKNVQAEKQKKIDAFRDKLQKSSPRIYRTLTSLSGLANGFISSTLGVGTSLGYMILYLCGKDKSDLSKRKSFYDKLRVPQSSKQKEAIYDPDSHHINLTWHNGVSTVSSSISQMFCLIVGGGGIGTGIAKITGASTKTAINIANKIGLFSFSFINQIGQSFQEANIHGLKGGTAFAYSMLSATIQSALELVSPNEILLGSGSGITQELIKDLVKEGGENSLLMLGKAFLKNVGMEIVEENIQEALQLTAGNLINMYADKKRGTEFGADWSWQNFTQTAIITTLTTGITTGISYAIQMGKLNQQDKTTLFNDVINDTGTYESVMEMLNRAISGEITIPNTEISSLQQLQIDLTNGYLSPEVNSEISNISINENTENQNVTLDINKENVINDIGSDLHEEWRKTRLNEDGTYDPRIKTTTDQTWIKQHDGQTEVDIANTSFENLPSDWQYENLEAAKVAGNLVYDMIKNGENITPEMIEDLSSTVHEERLKRNQWAKGGELDVPYSQLPEVEKAKDRNQILLAIEKTEESLISRENLEKFTEIGIIIPEGLYKKYKLYEKNFDFEKFKELTEKGLLEINLITTILDVNDIEIDINKRTKLKELGIYIDENVKELNDLEINFDKLTKIKDLGINIDSYDIKKLNNLEIDFDELRKIKNLGINIDSYNVKKLSKLKIDLSKFDYYKKLGFEITENNLEKLNNLEIDFDELRKIKNLGIDVNVSNIQRLENLKEIDYKKIEKLINAGIKITVYDIGKFNELEISDNNLLYIKHYGITQYKDVKFFLGCMKNADRGKMKEFIDRKNEYLQNNRTITLQRFNELFGGNGKYGKADINQRGLGYCYAYTGFELLKKTNGFNELIQTNLKETTTGWEVRLPFNDVNGNRIKINKNEIDKEFPIINSKGEERTTSINSESEYLGFKILEIAFIKQSIIEKYNTKKRIGTEIQKSLENAHKEFTESGDITLNGELLRLIEGGNTEFMLYDILPENYLISGFSYESLDLQMEDLAFNQYSKGLFKIDLGIHGLDKGEKNFGSNISITESKHGKSVIIDNVKIINKDRITLKSEYSIDDEGTLTSLRKEGEESKYDTDIVINKDGKLIAMFFQGHAYSIEKCYIDNKTLEKRVRVINPRHTGIKFDISLEQCKQVFDWSVIGINIDNMFRENTT